MSLSCNVICIQLHCLTLNQKHCCKTILKVKFQKRQHLNVSRNSTLVLGSKVEPLQHIWKTSVLVTEKQLDMKPETCTILVPPPRVQAEFHLRGESFMEVLQGLNQLMGCNHTCLMLMGPTSDGSQQGLRCSLFHLFLQHGLYVFCQLSNTLIAQPCHLLHQTDLTVVKKPNTLETEGYMLLKVQKTSTGKSQLQPDKALRLSAHYLHIRISLNQR